MQYSDIQAILADKAEYLLGFDSPKINKQDLHVPGPDFVDRAFADSDRSDAVKNNMKRLYNHGRLAGTGYVNILPIDQGIEHGAGISFYKNPSYFDPANIVKLAIEGGTNGVASTMGVLRMMSKQAETIPFIVKINHNELLTYPNKWDQIVYGSVDQAAGLGAVAIGATIYFGSEESNRQIVEVSELFEAAHQAGLFTILWCYPRNPGYKKDGTNYETAADITGQAIHLGATLGADIVKQKLPESIDGMRQVDFGKYDDGMYDTLLSDHPIDQTRYQVANAYMGRCGLINSGGASGDNDLQQAVMTAVINKRAGGIGLISGRKAFKKPLNEGVEILNAIQDVYLEEAITVA